MKLKINIKNYFDKGTKNNYINQSNNKSLIITKEVKNSFKEAAKDKAVSWDLIPCYV